MPLLETRLGTADGSYEIFSAHSILYAYTPRWPVEASKKRAASQSTSKQARKAIDKRTTIKVNSCAEGSRATGKENENSRSGNSSHSSSSHKTSCSVWDLGLSALAKLQCCVNSEKAKLNVSWQRALCTLDHIPLSRRGSERAGCAHPIQLGRVFPFKCQLVEVSLGCVLFYIK